MKAMRTSRGLTVGGTLLALALAAAVWAGGPMAASAGRVDVAGTSFAIGLVADRASVLLLVLVWGIAALVTAFASRHYDPGPARDRFTRSALTLVLALTLSVSAASIPLIAVGWTVSGLAAIRLLGHRGDPDARAAAGLVARRLLVGDALLWLGVVVAALGLGDLDRTALGGEVAAADPVVVTGVALLLVAAGAVRSALAPTHRWLAETTTAPTPVSALLHAGFVNGLGLLVVLTWPLFDAAGAARAALLLLGATTILVTTAQRFARPDTKGRLVTSTSSQMGYMAVQAGIGVPAAALLHLLGHALYKASLFLGAGGALRAAGHHPDPTSRRALAFGGGTALVTVVALAALGVVPQPLPAAAILFGVAGTAAALALATVAASPLPPVRRISMGGAVVLLLAGYVVGAAAFEVALHDLLPTWTAWTPVTTALVLTAALAAALATVAVDRAVRHGRAPRLHAWAIRSALPPRGARWRAGAALAGPAVWPSIAPGRRAEVRVIADEAAGPIGATYPLTDFVASNPLAGLEHLPFTEAVRRAEAVGCGSGFLPLAAYRSLHAAGEITQEALDRALDQALAQALDPVPHEGAPDAAPAILGNRTLSARELASALLHGPVAPELRAPVAERLHRAGGASGAAAGGPRGVTTIGELLDAHLGTDIATTVDHETSVWAAVFADRDTMRWSLPHRDRGLWASWRAIATGPGAARALGVAGFGPAISALPDRADDAVAALVDALELDPDEVVDQLARSLARTSGWTAHLQWAGRHHDGSGPLELLAIRLATEWALATATVAARLGDLSLGAVRRRFEGSAPGPVPTDETLVDDLTAVAGAAGCEAAEVLQWSDGELAALVDAVRSFDPTARAALWQHAYEESYRVPLLEAIAREVASTADRGADPQAGAPARPDRQVVLCIDVRSEPLRRQLEAEPGTETFGFAGFFGVPFEFVPFGHDGRRDQCPVLLRPRNQVHDVPRPDGADGPRALVEQRTVAATTAAGHTVEDLAPLAFAEVAGWGLGLAATVRTLAPQLAARSRARLLDRGRGIDLDPDIESAFTLEERTFLAENALRTFGLTTRFAPLVVLCGHGSTTENNPFHAGYQCGACGGHDGAPNARVAAAVLNDPSVRARLAERGIVVPDDTWFTPALHDTATDEVTLLETGLVPPTHAEALGSTREVLRVASQRTAVERARRLPFDRRAPIATTDPSAAIRRSWRRSRDWAEPRPEWGLAGNAAFVAGPRRVTDHLDLGGRAFLHSYEPAEDPDGTALETILTAPLVVAQWINNQYYFSTVDGERFGAGDKVVHNVTAGVGVISGPRGDLRIGLPRQATVAATGQLVHQPLRLQAIVVARPDLVAEIVGRHDLLGRLVDHGWISLAAIDPADGSVTRWSTTSDRTAPHHPPVVSLRSPATDRPDPEAVDVVLPARHDGAPALDHERISV